MTPPLKLLFFASLLSLLTSCDGDKHALIDDQKWLVVNYWATWCAPCREEIPELNQLAKLNPNSIRVVGVNYDAPPPPQASIDQQSMGIEFATISDQEASALGLEKPLVLPTTYLLNQQELLRELQGPQTLQSIQAAISELESSISR